MSELPLSKYYDRADYDQLGEELAIVDQHFHKGSPQSEHRRWEYAMALRAFSVWGGRATTEVADVGGAGSPLWRMVGVDNAHVIDPNENRTLADYLHGTQDIQPRLFPAVFCISVLEHVDDLDQFLYHLSCLTAPGGLLFLTFDCCGCTDHQPEQDPHHFNTMRKRIFTPRAYEDVSATLIEHNFEYLGGYRYLRDTYAPQLYGGATDPGYSFASRALVKRS